MVLTGREYADSKKLRQAIREVHRWEATRNALFHMRHDQGATLQELSNESDMDRTTIARILANRGVKVRRK